VGEMPLEGGGKKGSIPDKHSLLTCEVRRERGGCAKLRRGEKQKKGRDRGFAKKNGQSSPHRKVKKPHL